MRPKRCVKEYKYRDGQGIIGTSGVDTGAGVGTPVEAEMGTLGIVAPIMTASDEWDWFITLPRDLNWTRPVGIRVRYSTESTTASDTHTWIVLYDVLSTGTAFAVGSSPLDTTVAVDTDNGVANAWQDTPRGVINGNTFTQSNVVNSDVLAINVELDATDASEEINLHSILIDYVPKPGLGGPSSYDVEYDEEDA